MTEALNEPPDSVIGENGSIRNFMGDIAQAARESNGFVLEIGCGWGTGSTVAIQRGLKDHPNPLHVSVDHQDQLHWRPAVPWWHLVIGDSREFLTLIEVTLFTEDRPAGLIFIDTDHNYKQMSAELEIWSGAADKDTVWLFHDTHMWNEPNDDMVRAIKEFARAEGWIYEDYRTEAHGLGRMRR